MGIKSQPVYQPLEWMPSASAHLFVSAGEGALAVKEVLRELALGVSAITVLHLDPSGAENRYATVLENEFGVALSTFDGETPLMEKLERELASAPAGTALYLAGSERFIWHAAGLARRAGMSRHQVQAEMRGSKARRVYCVHCKAINENVTHSIHRCGGCGTALLVRDHYSRLMEAYVGFRIDAEEPGNVPESEELYA